MSLSSLLVLNTKSEGETHEIGKALGAVAYGGLTLAFSGGLGMGKTKFIQGIGNALGIKRIKSPTFIIVDEHESNPPLIHADLYRLENSSDIESLDLERYIDEGCLLAVEWAEYWKEQPKDNIIKINFEKTDENSRKITFNAFGERALNVLDCIKQRNGETIC